MIAPVDRFQTLPGDVFVELAKHLPYVKAIRLVYFSRREQVIEKVREHILHEMYGTFEGVVLSSRLLRVISYPKLPPNLFLTCIDKKLDITDTFDSKLLDRVFFGVERCLIQLSERVTTPKNLKHYRFIGIYRSNLYYKLLELFKRQDWRSNKLILLGISYPSLTVGEGVQFYHFSSPVLSILGKKLEFVDGCLSFPKLGGGPFFLEFRIVKIFCEIFYKDEASQVFVKASSYWESLFYSAGLLPYDPSKETAYRKEASEFQPFYMLAERISVYEKVFRISKSLINHPLLKDRRAKILSKPVITNWDSQIFRNYLSSDSINHVLIGNSARIRAVS